MSALPPVTLLYGDDEFAIAIHVKGLKSDLGVDENAALNVTEFEAAGLSFSEFRSVCESAPFLCSQRLVILTDLLAKETRKDLLTALIDYLPAFPVSTALLLQERVKIPKNNRLLKAVLGMEGAEVCEYALPANRDLPRWIIERASRAGGDFSAAAAQELAAGGVDSPRALQSEIEKLLAYVNWARTVTAEDVRRMVPSAATADIFRLVDFSKFACLVQGADRDLQLASRLTDCMSCFAGDLHVPFWAQNGTCRSQSRGPFWAQNGTRRSWSRLRARILHVPLWAQNGTCNPRADSGRMPCASRSGPRMGHADARAAFGLVPRMSRSGTAAGQADPGAGPGRGSCTSRSGPRAGISIGRGGAGQSHGRLIPSISEVAFEIYAFTPAPARGRNFTFMCLCVP